MTSINLKRCRLCPNAAVVPGGGDTSGGSVNTSYYSELLVVGYTERGIPLYDKKCLSNDNPHPYSDSWTDIVENSDTNDRDVDGGDGDDDNNGL